MKTGIRVMDAMTKGLISIKPEATVAACAKKMISKGVGGILVLENRDLKGIVTEKDMVEKIVAKGKDPRRSLVKEVMSRKIVSISPEEDLYEAMITMRDEEVRRLPVLHNKNPVGLLTAKDILRIEPSLFDLMVEKIRIKEAGDKPITMLGKCESCGAEKQLFNRDNSMLCEVCRGLQHRK